MAKIIVQKFSEVTLNSGKTKYKCIGTIDGELDNFDAWDKPELNVEFEANIKDDPKYGKSISTYSGGGKGGGGGFRNDPETRKEIIRQSSLAQAVAFYAAKAQFMEVADVRKALTGKRVVQLATYFAAYAEGRLTVAMSDDDVMELLSTDGSFEPADATKEARAESGPIPNKTAQDIHPDEIPF